MNIYALEYVNVDGNLEIKIFDNRAILDVLLPIKSSPNYVEPDMFSLYLTKVVEYKPNEPFVTEKISMYFDTTKEEYCYDMVDDLLTDIPGFYKAIESGELWKQ